MSPTPVACSRLGQAHGGDLRIGEHHPHDGVVVGASPHLLAGLGLHIDSSVATAVVDLVGQSASFLLQWAYAWEGQPQPCNSS